MQQLPACSDLTSSTSLISQPPPPQPSSPSLKSSSSSSPLTALRHRLIQLSQRTHHNHVLLYCSLFYVTFTHCITPAIAAPLTHNLPSEAAEQMEGLLHHLPLPLQTAMSSSNGFLPAFLQSLLLILACEIGDRTFFVAAILAMKSSRIVVWSGALFALAMMTVLSAGIGKAFPLLLDKKWTSIAAAVLFLYFGIQLLRDWWRMTYAGNGDGSSASGSATENEELAEVEEELKADEMEEKKGPAPLVRPSSITSLTLTLVSPVFAKAFSMTALAEWGDRSQIATIALAASRDMTGVIVGGIIGHSICTGVAVIGGRLLATSISERAVALMGGLLFVVFSFLTVGGVLQ